MKNFATLMVMGAMVALAGEARAADIVYFNDFAIGTDRMAQALDHRAAAGDTVVMVSSAAEFQSRLETGEYDLGIFFIQDFGAAAYAEAVNALGEFVADGGAAIYADWSRNSTLAEQFGATFDGSTNHTRMTISDTRLSQGLSDPVLLTSPGWRVFSAGLAGEAPAAVFEDGSGAIVVGHGGRSLVNGFLNDTFASGAEGVRLYENQIGFVLTELIEVAVDVKPGDDGNRINLRGRGMLPVAIFSDGAFDALDVDEDTVLLGDPITVLDGAVPVVPIRGTVEDVDGDGLDDLLLFFSIDELVEEGALDEQSVAVMLTGQTFGGARIEGADLVEVMAAPSSPGRGNGRGRGRGGR